MEIKIEMLRCFAEVARQGNLADAAARLGRSPSAVSMTLKHLQDQIGHPLFASDRKTQLTPLGAFVLEQAKAELAHFTHVKQSIAAFVDGGLPVLRIGAVPSAAAFLPAVIGRVYDLLPDVQITLRDQDSEQILRSLTDSDLDVGIATAPPRIFRMHRLDLITDAFGVVCCADHPLVLAGQAATVAAIQGYRFITNPLVSGLADPALRALGDGAKIHVTNTTSMLAMIASDLGVTILPKTAVPTNNSAVCFVPLASKLAARRIDALFPQSAVLSKSQTVLRDCLCAFFRG